MPKLTNKQRVRKVHPKAICIFGPRGLYVYAGVECPSKRLGRGKNYRAAWTSAARTLPKKGKK